MATVFRLLLVTALCAAAAPARAETGWNRFAEPANHFAVSLPASWNDIPSNPAVLQTRIAEALRKGNAGLVTAYRREAATPVSAYVRFRAFQYPPLSRTPGLFTDVAVIRDPIPAGTARFSVEDATEALAKGFRRTPSVQGPVRTTTVALPGRRAGRLEFQILVPSGGHRYPAAGVGYVFVTRRDVFLVYFRTRPVQLDHYRPVYRAIAARFETGRL